MDYLKFDEETKDSFRENMEAGTSGLDQFSECMFEGTLLEASAKILFDEFGEVLYGERYITFRI